MKKRSFPMIVGNWKTFPGTYKEALSFVKKLDTKVGTLTKYKDAYYLAVPDVYLQGLAKEINKGVIGAQHITGTTLGATTGQTTPGMLKSSGALFSILGHSEVRANGETTENITKKLELALMERLQVILCVGEQERDKHGNYLVELEAELKAHLEHIDTSLFSYLTIAYEPVWAIGKETPATVEECFEVAIALRRALASLVGIDYAKKVSILYGGTVTKENAVLFLKEGGVDGLLIGRASTDIHSFSAIIKEALSA